MVRSSPLIRRQEFDFLFHEWLGGTSEDERATVEAMLDVADRLASERFLACYRQADVDEPFIDASGVHVLPQIRDALFQYRELGLFSAGFPEQLGGLGLSHLVCSALYSQFAAANAAASAFTLLTAANARLIVSLGAVQQIEHFARPQIEGRWFGTMCLSEPQAGSSLGDIRTKAVADGEDALGKRFRLTGNKMWITGGDQDVSENVVHLVLAKEQGADGGLAEDTSGISLFIVPKILPDGERNDVVVAGLNHKMGYRGVPNCLLNFGEGEGALGWRVGESGRGLAHMFHMMNEARIAIGVGAAALAYRGYMHALAYAQERTQGRRIGVRSGTPIAIIEHADVKLMLLRQKVYAEGALALCCYCADLADRRDDDDAQELLGLLTPVAKSWPSEFGLAANDLAIQVHGGYGYTRDFAVEQLWRDNRLNRIHEGTTGIQAIDLLGRKLLRSDGRALEVLKRRVNASCERARSGPELSALADLLQQAFERIDATLLSLERSDRAYDDATIFLRAFGHVVVAWIWLDMALVGRAHSGSAFHRGKLRACDFFYHSELPHVFLWLDQVEAQRAVAASAPIEEF